jgi:AcrR family transcriptional regulator
LELSLDFPIPHSTPPAAGQDAPVHRDPRRSKKGRRTAERILDVAEEVFAEKGFEGATLREVANRVGIRIPSLYNHFAGKDALYAAVLERGIGPVLQTLAASAVDDQQSRSRILYDTLAVLAERPNVPRLVLHETLAGGRHLRKMLEEWLGPVLRQAQNLVESGPAAKRWEPEQLPHLVLAMYNIVVGYFAAAPIYRDLDGTDLLSPESLRRQTEFLQRLTELLFSPSDTPEQ